MSLLCCRRPHPQDLLALGFPYAVLLMSSYSNPVSVLRHAAAEGYRVVDFQVTSLAFGTYSSEPKVGWVWSLGRRGPGGLTFWRG